MWVLEIKSINDLTTAQLSPLSLPWGQLHSCAHSSCSLPLAFVKVLENNKVVEVGISLGLFSKQLETLKWGETAGGFGPQNGSKPPVFVAEWREMNAPPPRLERHRVKKDPLCDPVTDDDAPLVSVCCCISPPSQSLVRETNAS